MLGSTLVRSSVVGVALLCGLVLTSKTAPACPFCGMQGTTLVMDVAQANLVLYGTFTNAKLDGGGGFGEGTTDLQIDAVIKSHEILGGRKVLTVPRFIPPANNNAKMKWLVYCDVYKGKLDFYRGVPVAADSDMVKYLQGSLAVKDKPLPDRLKFAFDFLDNPETEISTDAYKEYANADYKDFRDMVPTLPPDRIAKWLEDPNTPAFRYGLYASMLGHCGKEKHAEVLLAMLNDPQKKMASGVDGILAGYAMLKRKDGWNEIVGILRNSQNEFMLRYAALRAIRFFWDYRTDLIDKKTLLEGITPLLSQSDIADLAIEDLRKWQSWDVCDQVLALKDLSSHNIPIVKRSILRYALSCPKASAVQYVAALRKQDPEMVKDAEELLKLEPAKNPT